MPRRIARAALAAIAITIGAASARPAAAQAGDRAAPVTLQDVVAYSLRHNADVIVGGLRIDSARAEVRIARAYPNPMLSATPGLPSQYGVAVPIDVGPGRTSRVRVATSGQRASRLDSADAARLTTYAARQGFFDLLLADSTRAVALQQRDIVQQLLQGDSARLRAGDVSERDVARTELALARADARLVHAGADVRAARLALQLVMGITAPDTGFTVAGPLRFRDAVLDPQAVTVAGASRPDVAAARERVRASEAARRLAVAQLVPTPTANLVYQPALPFASGHHFAPGIGLQIPAWNWFSGERARARAGVTIAEETERRTELQARSELLTATDALRANRGIAAAYEGGLLAKARADLDAARYAYGAGALSLTDLLNALATFIDVKTEYFTALHDYWIAVAAVDRAAGTDVLPIP